MIDSTQTPVATYAYDSFGVLMKKSGSFDQPYQFSTKEYDPETGFSNRGFRFYDAALGRWMTKDPLGEYGDGNLYRAIGNNPVNEIDPLGLFSITHLPAIPQPAVNFSAGLGDALLLGTGQYFRDNLGIGGVNRCSDAYRYGGWSSFTFGASRLAYAGLAKGGAVLAASGVEASAFRTALRNAFRLGIGANWRTPNLTKYATDEALRAAAGRTNSYINAYGAGVAAAGGAEGAGCGCK